MNLSHLFRFVSSNLLFLVTFVGKLIYSGCKVKLLKYVTQKNKRIETAITFNASIFNISADELFSMNRRKLTYILIGLNLLCTNLIHLTCFFPFVVVAQSIFSITRRFYSFKKNN